MKRFIAIDTETGLIRYKHVVPELVCLSLYEDVQNRAGLLTPEESSIDKILIDLMADEETSLVGHNIPYDLSVLMWEYPDLLPKIFQWLREGRIYDTLIREKLMNLTMFGEIDMLAAGDPETGGVVYKKAFYTLGALEFKYLGIDRSDEKEDSDAPRMNYIEVKGTPIKEWPSDFVRYAKEDAVNTLKVFKQQNNAAAQVEAKIRRDPFVTQSLQMRKWWGLRLIEVVGTRVDRDQVPQIKEEIMSEYMSDRLRDPLLKAGILVDATPEMPYVNKAKAHVEGCKDRKNCDCPLKMKKGQPEKYSTNTLQDYVFNLASKSDLIDLKPNDSSRKLLKEHKLWDKVIDEEGHFRREYLGGDRTLIEGEKKKVSFTLNEEWKVSYAAFDPVLELWAERTRLAKMANTYIPQMYIKDDEGVPVEPAEIIHASYDPLKKTGRTSSFASKNYPSRNDQNVDPRIRACTIPREGNVLVSTDYSAMELGTLAQTAYDLFGESVLRDKINAGVDTHAYLGANIAVELDADFRDLCGSHDPYEVFAETKDLEEPCEFDQFSKMYVDLHPELTGPVTYGHFYDHYRTFAKPTGLGYPGGLGPKTFIAYAKTTYGLTVDIETATRLRDIWRQTYPELALYLEYISKKAIDPYYAADVVFDEDRKPSKRVWYSYTTPHGLYRPRCTFCAAANGMGLQAPSAEGAAGLALPELQEKVWLAEEGSLFDGTLVLAFIHDEFLWECPEDDKVGLRARRIESIMIGQMQIITPDVKAGAESAAMRRWNKKAKGLWDGDVLKVWEPK